jgi:L-malate glycosyltransferase
VSARSLRIGLVGPLPPPSGGMANQTRQLARLLEQDGIGVEIVQVNAPYRPGWIGAVPCVRALFRLLPYVARLWTAARRVQLFHVMANSGWAWHLFVAPAVWIARLRRIPVVVNYRGGGAEEFLSRSFFWVAPTLRAADRLVVPSGFLQEVFRRFGVPSEVVPNIVDLGRFTPRAEPAAHRDSPHLVVTRNLEPIYDIGTALEALALIRKARPGARLTVAGSGPESARLEALARELGLADQVTFTGRLDNDEIAGLYRQADVCVNPSLVDNMPISLLEALASGVPVVSTDVGGVRFVVRHGESALLVPPGNPEEMARAVLDLLADPDRAARIVRAGRESVQQYTWSFVRPRLLDIYRGLVAAPGANPATEAK